MSITEKYNTHFASQYREKVSLAIDVGSLSLTPLLSWLAKSKARSLCHLQRLLLRKRRPHYANLVVQPVLDDPRLSDRPVSIRAVQATTPAPIRDLPHPFHQLLQSAGKPTLTRKRQPTRNISRLSVLQIILEVQTSRLRKVVDTLDSVARLCLLLVQGLALILLLCYPRRLCLRSMTYRPTRSKP